MNLPQKSSDEILQELFGLCLQQRNVQSEVSSQDDSSDCDGDPSEDGNIRQKKHKSKKKKKKHKKGKKRKNDLSENEEIDTKFSKRKVKKIKKEPGVEDENVPEVSKVELKIKTEKPSPSKILNEKSTNGDLSLEDENASNNYINTVTGKSITLDDVFHTLGIVTEEQMKLTMKQEKHDTLLRPDQIKKEKLDESEETKTVKAEKVDDPKIDVKSESKQEPQPSQLTSIVGAENQSKKPSVSEVFTDEADKQITVPKKINIKDLKNSQVYEATIKEIEEREKQRAEKLEEGELSTDSSSSENDSIDADIKEDLDEFVHSSEEREKKHKSHHKKKKKHRSHSRKKKHRQDEEHKSRRKHKTFDHNEDESSRSHSRHHRSERSRSRSVDNEFEVTSKRSHKPSSRSRKERSSRDESRSRSRSKAMSDYRRKSESVERIDKKKLLEIARKNAINLLQRGALPASVVTSKIVSIKAGGKTVDELTDFCKQLSKKEALGDDSDHMTSGDESADVRLAFHHPFQLKERPSNIVMNIRNAISLPTKTAQEKTLELSKQLSLQYPVSSGQQHQSEWVPVEKPQGNVHASHSSSSYSKAVVDPKASVSYSVPETVSYPSLYQPPPPPPSDSIVLPQKNFDISSIVAQRLEAIRRLSENPQDPIGTNLINAVDTRMTVWAESKVQPGLFTGSTGVKPLSVAELSGGFQAWPKKNQFIAAKPVFSDKGQALMKKMGWQPGEGLGKYKQGPALPCEISMKTDRKGLTEQPIVKEFKQTNSLQKAIEITQNKHPVSLLNEFCSRRKLPAAQYDCEEREGVGKRKLFLFSVTLQGARYTPKSPSVNKKQSKMEAATVCLQALGLIPTITS